MLDTLRELLFVHHLGERCCPAEFCDALDSDSAKIREQQWAKAVKARPVFLFATFRVFRCANCTDRRGLFNQHFPNIQNVRVAQTLCEHMRDVVEQVVHAVMDCQFKEFHKDGCFSGSNRTRAEQSFAVLCIETLKEHSEGLFAMERKSKRKIQSVEKSTKSNFYNSEIQNTYENVKYTFEKFLMKLRSDFQQSIF